MDNKFVTLAIHSSEKANILQKLLVLEGVEVVLEPVDDQPNTGIRVKVLVDDLPKAVNIVESRHLDGAENDSFDRKDDGKPRILVPVDFSEYSLRACEFAFNFAKVINAKVKIMHVYFNPYFPSALPINDVFAYQGKETEEFQSVVNKVKKNILELCKKIDDRIADNRFPSVNYSYVLREGLPEEEIVAFAKNYHPELIIMGTRGKDQKDIDLIGSVTAEVIEMGRIPLIALPELTQLYSMSQVKNMAFLCNFSQRDFLAFDKMVTMLKPFQKDLHIYVTHALLKKSDKKSDKEITKIKEYFKTKYPDINIELKLIQGDELVETLEAFIRSERIDILALTSNRHNLFSRLFISSIPRKMLFYSDTPLFVVRG